MIAVNGSSPFLGSYDRPINLPTDRQASREVIFPIKKGYMLKMLFDH